MIVAAVDRSEQAEQIVSEGKTLADTFDDQLHIIHVLSRQEFANVEQDNVSETGHAMDPEEVREIAAEIAADATSNIEDFTAVGLIGQVSEEIIEYANEHDARYIIVGGRKRSPVGKAVFGSVTQSILLNANRPVLAVLQRG